MGVMDPQQLDNWTVNQITFLYLIHKEFIYIHGESETYSIGTEWALWWLEQHNNLKCVLQLHFTLSICKCKLRWEVGIPCNTPTEGSTCIKSALIQDRSVNNSLKGEFLFFLFY